MTRRKKIPSMLNTLTILTFIGSGFSLLGSIISLVSLPQMREKVKEGMKNAKMPGEQPADEADMLEVITEGVNIMLDNGEALYTVAITTAILCIFGAILMRKLKKSGFFIYTSACILNVVFPLTLVGFGLFGLGILIGGLVSILFIILYSVNLKEMTKT
jgi:hypothetical protein